MAIETDTNVPSTFRAGDTTKWTVGYSDYPASSWSLNYYFKRPGEPTVNITATASGTDFAVTLSAEDSSQFVPGRWQWHARAEKQSDGSIIAESGKVDVLPDPSAVDIGESFAIKALALVESSLAGDLVTAQESISIAGVDITKMGISERFDLRDRLKAEVSRERTRATLKEGSDMPGRNGLQIRFKNG